MSTYAAPTSHPAARPTRGRPATIALWALQGALALAFVGAGGSKLAGAAPMVQLFDALGVGQWLRYVTGALEVAGAVLLVLPRLARLGALQLAGVMLGAIAAHLFVLHTSAVAPAVLLTGLLAVAYLRRGEPLTPARR
jgi:uncharacterized membrane protein YphA (DoxX/SURF4 family)